MIAGINIRMVGITIYKRANKPSINHLLIYSFLRSHVGVFFRLGGCGCDCRTRLWPRGPDNSERPCFGWIPQQLWRHVSPSQLWKDAAARSGMHGFQHIPTYSTCQSSPTARICPKMGYPLNPWNPMVYHHFSTSRLLFWGMSQWATPLDHCSTLFLAPEDTVISTPPSFSSTKSDRRSQLGLLDPLKKNTHTNGYGSIPINTIFSGMNIHLQAILMFTRGTRFWHTAK